MNKVNDMSKIFYINSSEIKKLIPEMGGAIATDKIMVEGFKIGNAYREYPRNEMDNGWRFFSGDETQEYLDNSSNSGVYSMNTIANYDPAIIPYLHLPYGTELERVANTDEFEVYLNENQ